MNDLKSSTVIKVSPLLVVVEMREIVAVSEKAVCVTLSEVAVLYGGGVVGE